MGIFDGCLLACDIDGTLVENGWINPLNIEKIEFFVSEGGAFSLSTGRSIGAVSDVIAKIPRLSPCVVANGCMIYDYGKKETIYEDTISRNDYHLINIIKNSGLDVGIEIHSRENVYAISQNETSLLHQEYEKFSVELTDFHTVSKYSWNKTLMSFKTAEDREKAHKLLENEKRTCDFIDTCAIIGGVPQNYYEQIPSGVSKFTALQKLCEILNIKKGRLFAIGDFYNDLEMIKNADISAVPVTSPDDLKVFADYVTKSCKDGAVADFIDYLTKKYTE